MMQISQIFDDEAAIGINVFLNLTVVRHLQGMGNGERYKRLANALRTLQMLPNALPTLPMACKCLQKLTANGSICNIR